MQKINPLQTLVRARLANIDLNQEVDALIEAMRASFSAPAALLEPVDTLDGQLNAHLELRQGLVTRLAWLPSHQQTLEQHAALIKDSLASYCLLGVKVDLKGATALTQLPTNMVGSAILAYSVGTRLKDTPPDLVATVPTEEPSFKLNDDQSRAYAMIKEWLEGDGQFFALRGYAGTGKSTLMRIVKDLNYNFHFSAPTNKAAKVLSNNVGHKCKTTYSLLGMRMEQDEDKLVLKPVPDAPQLGRDPILVIDEAGCIPTVLSDLIVDRGYRVLFVGDPAQLNPIGEIMSPVWKLAKKRITMKKVERFDNELLGLSIAIRDCLKDKVWESPIVSKFNKATQEGVYVLPRRNFTDRILALKVEDWDTTKVCCWRNKTVDNYNELIREGLGFKNKYDVGDRVLLASPLMDGQAIVAYVDEEFVVEKVLSRKVKVYDPVTQGSVDIATYDLQVGRDFSLKVPKDVGAYESFLNSIASEASRASGASRRDLWKAFWNVKAVFATVRYGYAMTAHRLQGTTLTNVFVDQSDILANPNKPEAFRALYVASTRPTKQLVTF